MTDIAKLIVPLARARRGEAAVERQSGRAQGGRAEVAKRRKNRGGERRPWMTTRTRMRMPRWLPGKAFR